MANVEDEQTPGAKGAAGSLDRAERGDRGGLKALPREDDDQIDPEEYAQLLDSYDSSFRNIAEGEVVKGTVLKVTASEVIVDVGYKSEGIIAVDEFVDENGLVTVEPGDIVDVLLERTEDREGYVVLSREKAEKMKIWDEVEKAYAARGVSFVTLYPDKRQPLEKQAAFHAQHGFVSPRIDDDGGAITKLLKGSKTPEFVVCDAQGVIRYRGALDESEGNWQSAKKNYLTDALDAVLAAKKVEVETSTPVG